MEPASNLYMNHRFMKHKAGVSSREELWTRCTLYVGAVNHFCSVLENGFIDGERTFFLDGRNSSCLGKVPCEAQRKPINWFPGFQTNRPSCGSQSKVWLVL